MSKVYKKVPNNFSEIEQFLIIEASQIRDQFYTSEKHYFYDTCSFIHHSNAKSNSSIIEFIKLHGANIIITRTVLMELSSNNGDIDQVQVDYFRKINENGISILLLDEENSLGIIKEALNINSEDANKLLGYAIKEVSKSKTAINNVIKELPEILKSKILSSSPGSEDNYERFFKFSREQKCEGDSLAEELILILIVILTKIPIGKYIILSDDLKIRNHVISIRQYIEKQHSVRAPMQLTTSRLVYEMHRKQILTSTNEMMEILDASSHGNIKVYCMGEEDIQLVRKLYTKEELLNRIITESNFSVAH
ncbi:MAG: hypothetical protein N4A40_13985 [Tissierellales bacterium]|nr:hypothetical protein [Tissierellales bacterium]